MHELTLHSGNYISGEKFSILRPIETDRIIGRPWIVGPHGRGGDHTANLQPLYGGEPAYALARAGFPHIGIDAGGPYEWASDKAFTAIEGAIAYVRANFAAHPTKFYIMGGSMGGLTSFAYFGSGSLKNQIAGAVGVIPACDVNYHYTNNSAYKADIDAAWAPEGGYTVANRDRKDPTRMASAGAYAGRGSKIQIWYAPNDGTVPQSTVLNFATAAGVPNGNIFNIGNVGHMPYWRAKEMVDQFLAWDAA